eukprot:SAG11_NODE_5183_length_1637_cov_2.002601_3_plen_64_part_01
MRASNVPHAWALPVEEGLQDIDAQIFSKRGCQPSKQIWLSLVFEVFTSKCLRRSVYVEVFTSIF